MFGIEERRQEREIKFQIAERQQLYKLVFDTPEGKKVLEDLAKRCFAKNTTFSENNGQMAFNEGRRSIYVFILSMVEKDLTEILEELTKG